MEGKDAYYWDFGPHETQMKKMLEPADADAASELMHKDLYRGNAKNSNEYWIQVGDDNFVPHALD